MDQAFNFLAQYSTLANDKVFLAIAIFTRLSALLFFMPGIGERTVPVRVRLIFALAMMLILTPAVGADYAAPTLPSHMAADLAAEALNGALIGFSVRAAVFAIQIAGVVASQSLSLQQLLGAQMSFDPETPVSSLLMIAGIVLLLTAGVHYEIFAALTLSYDFLPIGHFPGASAAGEWAANRAAAAFASALSLSLPFVVLAFIYNLALGAANRAMPQLMVAFVGIPAITLAGLCLLAACAPFILAAWLELTRTMIAEFTARLS